MNRLIKHIPDGWKVKSIDEITTIGSGKDYKHLNKGSIPVYGTGGIMTYVDSFLYDGDSIGIGRKGTIDKPQYLTGKFWTVDTLFYTHSFKESKPKFLYYLFSTINWKLYNEASGVPSLSKKTIEKIRILLPPLPEQQKIASILSKWDELIETQTQLIEEKEKQKKGLMQKLLTGEVRFPGFEEEWEEVRLGDICKKKSSNLSANSLGDNEGQYKVYGATGFLQYTDFYNEDKEFISIVKDGAGVGRVLLCEAKSSVLGTLEVITPKEKVDIFYLYSILQSINFKKYITGSTIPHVYFKDYASEKIRIPGYAEQQEVAKFLFNCDEEIQLLKDELEAIKLQKKGLMQQLLTGKIRVKIK